MLQSDYLYKRILSPSIFTPCVLLSSILAAYPMQAAADHLTLPRIDVRDYVQYEAGSRALSSADSAMLFADNPAVDIYQAGGISSLPAIRGLNDDRIKFSVDGMNITSACGNHINPALSYISPSSIEAIEVMAGITPVSMGGDSIAGTINVSSPAVSFAPDADRLLVQATASSFYRSNNNGLSADIRASVANQNMSLGFHGGVDRAQSYEDGRGNKVNSTQYDRRYQGVVLGLKGEDQDLTVRINHQDILYQGFPNQRMDMTGNSSDSVNARYRNELGWGKLDASVFWQQVDHTMGFFSSEKTGAMPMVTKGKDYGYSWKLDVPVSEKHLLRVGNDYQRQSLDDYWPPVATSGMMSPNTYRNINGGKRERLGMFVEMESKLTQEWSTLLGIRHDYVRMDTGNVQPYNGMGADSPAANAFNVRDKSQSDNHIDITATAKYEGNQTSSIEFGYARKTRSPNLYERYTWGRGDMAMLMTGWFGDVNGYVGDINLKPETANIVSATFNWHDASKQQWSLSLTPYYTYIQNYIGVQKIGMSNLMSNPMMPPSRPLLQFDNQDVRIYGIDASWKAALWSGGDFGKGRLSGNLSWKRGERLSDGQNLYHMMPLNMRLALEQNKGAWSNALEVQLVAKKTQVDDDRLEPKTSGYGLVNLRSSYQWKNARLDVAANNIFDKYYQLPLGGVAYSDWKEAGFAGMPGALPGMGRSINVGLTLNY